VLEREGRTPRRVLYRSNKTARKQGQKTQSGEVWGANSCPASAEKRGREGFKARGTEGSPKGPKRYSLHTGKKDVRGGQEHMATQPGLKKREGRFCASSRGDRTLLMLKTHRGGRLFYMAKMCKECEKKLGAEPCVIPRKVVFVSAEHY